MSDKPPVRVSRFPSHWTDQFAHLVRIHLTGEQAKALIEHELELFASNGGDRRTTAQEFKQYVHYKHPKFHVPDTWKTERVEENHGWRTYYMPFDAVKF